MLCIFDTLTKPQLSWKKHQAWRTCNCSQPVCWSNVGETS